MDLILEGIQKAFSLLISLDAEVLGITGLSLMVSGAATFISLVLGISTGMSSPSRIFRGSGSPSASSIREWGSHPSSSGSLFRFFCGETVPSVSWRSSIPRWPSSSPRPLLLRPSSWEYRLRPFSTCRRIYAFRFSLWVPRACR